MSVDLETAERFILCDARLLDRHRLATMLHGASVQPVLEALRAYRNADGGFGHALEPDVRGPASEPASVLHALEVLEEVDAMHDEMVARAAAWIASIASPDGGVPFVTALAAEHPRAPWMVPSEGGSQLTFALAGALWLAPQARANDVAARWLQAATEWCWSRLERPQELSAYAVKFALDFLDRVPEEQRARECIESLRPRLGADGTMPVAGGTEDERLGPLKLCDRPARRSRALFDEELVASELDALERAQQDDGGWTFDWLAWSPGQEVEWRGAVTLRALSTLRAHGRIAAAPGERRDRARPGAPAPRRRLPA
jgi:GNAT superfamily N-acetyltransferase